jgi:hypothetical protein
VAATFPLLLPILQSCIADTSGSLQAAEFWAIILKTFL